MALSLSFYDTFAAGDLGSRQQGIILREQERLKDLTTQSRRLTPPPKQPDPKEKKERALTQRRFQFEDISLKGVTCLEAETVSALTRPYVNKALSVDHINQPQLWIRSIISN